MTRPNIPPNATPAVQIALMDHTGPVTLLSRNQVLEALSIKRTALARLIADEQFPPGIPYSKRAHIKRWCSHWCDEFKRRKIAAAQEKVLAGRSA